MKIGVFFLATTAVTVLTRFSCVNLCPIFEIAYTTAHIPVVLGWAVENADRPLKTDPVVFRGLCEALLLFNGWSYVDVCCNLSVSPKSIIVRTVGPNNRSIDWI